MAWSVIAIEPVRVPVVVGVNVTFTVQVPPLAASVVGQDSSEQNLPWQPRP